MAFFHRHRAELAVDWEDIVRRSVGVWRSLDDDERDVLAGHIEAIVTTRRWEAAQGFELDDRIRTTIAAQAGLLVLGLGMDHLRDVGAIIVHPSTMTFDSVRSGPVAGTVSDGPVDLLGEANHQGPVVIAWDAAKFSARHPDRGHDVVLHEFAHKLDMLDHIVDGTPPLPDERSRRRWIEVCTRELADLRRADEHGRQTLLDHYGATDPAEFFAVATETFFTRAEDLEAEHLDLYEILRDFYRQDTAERSRRGPRPR